MLDCTGPSSSVAPLSTAHKQSPRLERESTTYYAARARLLLRLLRLLRGLLLRVRGLLLLRRRAVVVWSSRALGGARVAREVEAREVLREALPLLRLLLDQRGGASGALLVGLGLGRRQALLALLLAAAALEEGLVAVREELRVPRQIERRDAGNALAEIDEGLSCGKFRNPEWVSSNRPEWPPTLVANLNKYVADVPQRPIVMPQKGGPPSKGEVVF